jgi:trimeric autotransporter adhesin
MRNSQIQIRLLTITAWVVVFLTSIFSSRAVPGDEHWDGQFGAPGVTNIINAVAVKDGIVHIAGAATAGRTNAPLYLWDGKQWSVGGMFTGPIGMAINDLAFVGNTLYVGGSFRNVDGLPASGLAKWDGTNWSSLSFTGVVSALAVEGNNLYVGGSYTNAGGVTVTNIGYWDGNAWNAMGAGVTLRPGFAVRALAIQSGQVYVGGFFTNCGSQFTTNIAVWNGSVWSPVGAGVNGLGVSSLGFHNGELYASGTFSQAGETSANGIAKWNGANWSGLGTGLAGGSGAATSIASFNGLLCIVGSFTSAGDVSATNVATWNGTLWSAAGHLNAFGNRAVAAGEKLYVGGAFTVAGGVWVNLIAAWDGSQWSALGTYGRQNGIQSSVSSLASDGTNVYAGGAFTYAGRATVNNVARFDGANWQPLGAGLNNSVNTLAATNNLVYVGGRFTGTRAGGTALPYFGRWDGTNWSSMGSAGGLVYATAVGPNGVYAAGTYYTGSAYGAPFFNRWTGSTWSNMLVFPPDTTFFAMPLSDPVGYNSIAFQGTNIYLGGNIMGFTQFPPNDFENATNCQNVIRFDGTYGWIMGTGLNRTNVAMAVLGSRVFAAGTFTLAGGLPANQIAQWDGTNWSGVGGGVVGTGTVLALATMGHNLYAGGNFTNMGGVSASRIAKWDGTNWSALGSGLSGSAFSLVTIGSNLYVGGSFRVAGNKPASFVARWNEQINLNIPQLLDPEWPANGPFRVRLSGISGQINIIQASTNLITWTPILTNTTGIYDFTDPNSISNRSRFYRAALAQ